MEHALIHTQHFDRKKNILNRQHTVKHWLIRICHGPASLDPLKCFLHMSGPVVLYVHVFFILCCRYICLSLTKAAANSHSRQVHVTIPVSNFQSPDFWEVYLHVWTVSFSWFHSSSFWKTILLSITLGWSWDYAIDQLWITGKVKRVLFVSFINNKTYTKLCGLDILLKGIRLCTTFLNNFVWWSREPWLWKRD